MKEIRSCLGCQLEKQTGARKEIQGIMYGSKIQRGKKKAKNVMINAKLDTLIIRSIQIKALICNMENVSKTKSSSPYVRPNFVVHSSFRVILYGNILLFK
jgi:hypothetical protein